MTYFISGGAKNGKSTLAQDLSVALADELGHPPQKADFDDATKARIKTFLGPWPRALEAAGLKEPKCK